MVQQIPLQVCLSPHYLQMSGKSNLCVYVRKEQPVFLGGSDGLMESYKYEDVFLSLKIKYVKGNDFV